MRKFLTMRHAIMLFVFLSIGSHSLFASGRYLKLNPKRERALTAVLESNDLLFPKINGTDIEKREPIAATQQNPSEDIRLRGTVTDEKGEPIIGANIFIPGTTIGTVTDIEGKYSLSVPKGSKLVFSYIGYDNQTFTINNQTILDVSLRVKTSDLDELVVVGYGTQKKVNLTGAVDQATSKVFDNRPISNVVQGLQGVIPNLNLSFSDGKPMRSSGFNIRGNTSIGQGGAALVLIDGVEGDPSMLNPNDIASISVLKDASSAAIYGARGAFGVVLITTKDPDKEKTSVSYSGNISVKSPTIVPDMVTDAYEYASRFKEAYSAYYDYTRTPSTFHKAVKYNEDWYKEMAKRRPGSGLPEVETAADGTYLYYANTDWYGLLYKDHLFSHDHSVTVQGGGSKSGFMVSGHYNKQEGLFTYNSDDYSLFNIRAKGSARIYPWLTVSNNMEYSQRNYFNPLTVADGNVWYGLESEAQPMSPMFNPDGTLTMAAAYSVGDFWFGKSGTNYGRRILKNTTSFATTFWEHSLRVNGDITFQNRDGNNMTKRVPVPYSPQKGVIAYLGSSTNDLWKENSLNKYLAINLYGEYEKTFKDRHYVKGMVGYNYEQSISDYQLTRRNGLIFNDADNLNLTNGSSISIPGDYAKWRIAGGFFRMNYVLLHRYLFEVNGRLDGSSKFPVKQQWAFFPSFSAGWRISEEPFWHIGHNVVSDLKIRGSYGSLGNGNIAPYAFQELFNIYQSGRLISGELKQTTQLPNIIPDGLTWETATTLNLGADIGFVGGKLRFSGDYYVRKTQNMFSVGKQLPAIFGAEVPKGNYADMTTKGYELSLSWNDRFSFFNKPLSYDIRLTLADYSSVIDKYNNPEKNLGEYYEGMTVGEIWGYVTEGFFVSEEDVKNHASQKLYYASNSGKWLPGDIKFKDLNDDNVIDYGTNKVSDPGDRKIIGNSTPRYTFSANLGADWNGFFFSVFFQGVGKQNWWPGFDNALFWGQYNRPYNNIPKSMLNEIWSEENPNTYFPRYRGYVALQGTRELSVVQTRYLQNVAYLRLKNLRMGYNLPKNILRPLKMQAGRIYLSGENIYSWSPLYKHTRNFDVSTIYGEDYEAKNMVGYGGKNSIIASGGRSYNYPLLRSLSIGLSVTF